MDLETFIAETLRQIVKGVRTAQEHQNCALALINETIKVDKSRLIEFDVALTVTEGSEAKAGIGVFSGVFGVGTQANTSAANSSVSRIKFSVPIILPTQ
jgi:hypothetical protein